MNQHNAPNKWLVALLVSAGIFIALLDTTIVDIVLPKMMASLEADLYGIQWVIIAYFMGAAVSMTVVGWMAEAFGHRNTYLVGLVMFVATSALCGVAPTLELMLISRFVQGVAEGMMLPVGALILMDAFPEEERGLALGVYGLGASFAPAVGPTLGGFITEHLTWRWVFWVNVPIGLTDALLVFLLLGNVRGKVVRKLDLVGLVLLATSLMSFIVFISKGQEKGWLDSDFILKAFLVFVVTFVAFIVWELKAPDPLLPRNLFTQPNVVLALVAMAFVSMAAYGVFLMLPVYLQKLKGFTTMQAGLIMLPGSLAAALTTLLAGILSDKLQPKWVGVFFLICMAVTTWQFRTGFFEPRSAAVWDNFWWGLAMGGVFTPLFLILLGSLPKEEFSDASMVMNVVRLVMGSVGTAYATNVFTNRSASFYDALAARVEVGSFAAGELVGRLGGGLPADSLVYPEAQGSLFASVQMLLQAVATGHAFQATWRHLALWSALALLVTLLARPVRRTGGAAPLH
ncbi:MAG: DHA2 family efflux MFS transporter permease subunit [Thermoanaerobaculum sp.]|nr:DHA2 family efflux MFS transporter permease subunit [Thermoanaerobaculum sp.]